MHATKGSYGNKLKSMTAEIGLIYATKSKICHVCMHEIHEYS